MTLGEYLPNSNTKLLLHLNGSSADSSGLGNNGTDTSITYSQANGKFGMGAGFNGSSSKIIINNNVLPSTPGPYTISCWVKKTASQNYCIASDRAGGSYSYRIIFRITAIGNLELTTDNVSGGDIVSDAIGVTAIANGVWTHCVGVYDYTNGIKVYVNGKLDGAGTFTTNSYPSQTNALSIGVFTGPVSDSWFNGSLDEVIVENVAWTPQQVAKYYANSLGRYATL